MWLTLQRLGNSIPAVGNNVLRAPQAPVRQSARVQRSVERALAPRYSAYLDEVERLITAAAEEMREQGTIEPRVGDIVRRAGLSNQVFYRHFRSKDELLVAVLERGLETLLGYLDHRMQSAATPLGKVREWIEGVLAQALRPRAAEATRPFVLGRVRLLERLPEDVVQTTERLVEPLRAAIAAAAAAGELRDVDPDRDAEAIYQLAISWLHEALARRVGPDEDGARHLVEFALRGLGYAGGRDGA